MVNAEVRLVRWTRLTLPLQSPEVTGKKRRSAKKVPRPPEAGGTMGLGRALAHVERVPRGWTGNGRTGKRRRDDAKEHQNRTGGPGLRQHRDTRANAKAIHHATQASRAFGSRSPG